MNHFLPKLIAGALAVVGLASAQDISCEFKPVASTTTEAQKTAFLTAHNNLRRTAGVTNNLVWDDKLAQFAQGYANALAEFDKRKIKGGYNNWPHSTSSCYGTKFTATSGAHGENIGGGNGTPETAVESYGAEAKNFSTSTMTCNTGTECNHWVQAVSTKVTKVGCSKAPTSGWVCSYDVVGAQKCTLLKYAEFLKPVPVFKTGDKVEMLSMMTKTWKPGTVTTVTGTKFGIDFGGGATATAGQPVGCPNDMVRAAAK